MKIKYSLTPQPVISEEFYTVYGVVVDKKIIQIGRIVCIRVSFIHKGTVSQDFLPSVFSVSKHLPGLFGVSSNDLDFFFLFMKLFAFEVDSPV